MGKLKFLHISDMHLYRSDNQTSCNEEIKRFDRKTEILKFLTGVIEKESIKAVFVSGDFETDYPEDIVPIFEDWIGKGAKVFAVFGDHETKPNKLQKAAALAKELKELDGCIFFDSLKVLDDDDLGLTVYGMPCDAKCKGDKVRFDGLTDFSPKYPAVFLTHYNDLSTRKMRTLGCSYYGTGHRHTYEINKIGPNIYHGIAGQLFSCWDGTGKAWPTGYITGELGKKGTTKIKWHLAPGPQSRRMIIDPFCSQHEDRIYIENCPKDKTEKLGDLCEAKWFVKHDFIDMFEGFYIPEEGKDKELLTVVLEAFPEDIFVTPTSKEMKKKYKYDRLAATAKSILGNPGLFNEFVERTYLATEKSQWK